MADRFRSIMLAGVCLVVAGSAVAQGIDGQAFYRYTDTEGQRLRDLFQLRFPDRYDVLLGGTVTSDPARIRIPDGTTISIDEGEIRVCADSDCGSQVGSWSKEVRVDSGSFVQARRPAPTAPDQIVTSNVGVSGITASFSARGTTPSFATPAPVVAEPGKTAESGLVTFRGWTETGVTVEGGEYRICARSGSCTSYGSGTGRIHDGDQVQIRLTSGTYDEKRTATVIAGGVQATFAVTTRSYDSSPDAFSFPQVADAEPGEAAMSAAVPVTGHDGVDVTVTGHTSAQYRICAQADCSDKGTGGWTKAAGRVARGELIQVRVATTTFDEVVVANVQAGTTASTFQVTARPHDDVPSRTPLGEDAETSGDPSDLGTTRVSGAEPGATVTSASATLQGFDTAPISISGTGASYSVNGGSFTTDAGSVRRGDTVQVRVIAGSFSQVRQGVLSIGGGTATFEVTTRVKDTVPSAFALGTGPTGVEPGSTSLSTIATVSGFDDAPVFVSGAGTEYRVCKSADCSGVAFGTAPGTISSGDRVQVRLTAGTYSETRTATLDIGGVTGTWSSTVRVKDTVPTPYSFPSGSSVPTATLQTSGSVTLAGFDDAPISVVGGSYSLNGGAWTTVPGTAKANDALRLQVLSGGVSETTTVTTDVGGVMGSFSVTARPADTTPDTFSFPTLSNLSPSSGMVMSSIVRLTGHDPVSVSISGGTGVGYQICTQSNCSDKGSTFTNAVTQNVVAGSYLRLTLQSPATPSSSSSATITVGSSNVSWSVQTRAYQSCTTPWGSNVSHGRSVTAYQSNTANTNSQCSQYASTRTCNDGTLSGSGNYAFCEVPRYVSVTCTSNAGNTRTVTAYAAGQDPLTGRAPSNAGTWVIYRSGRALNCDDSNNYPYNQDINPWNTPSDSQTCQAYGGSGYGTYLHSCYWN